MGIHKMIGDEITINARVVREHEHEVLVKTKSGYFLVIHKEDINTVLSTNYSPKEIEIDIGSYPLYRYIATR